MNRIEFYQKPSGRVPVHEFLSELKVKNPALLASVLQDLDLLADCGVGLHEPHAKYLRDGVYELRSRHGSDISRIFYFFFTSSHIVLTNGFIKKTQKTPPGELAKALKYKKDYEENHGGN